MQQEFEESSLKTCFKCCFWNELTQGFTEILFWNVELLGNLLKEFEFRVISEADWEIIIRMPKTRLGYSSFTNKKSDLVCSSPDAWSIVIKKAYVGSCVHVWDREEYIAEAEKTTKTLIRELTLKVKSYRISLKQVMIFLKVWKEKERYQKKNLNISL